VAVAAVPAKPQPAVAAVVEPELAAAVLPVD
jgi:hypothetical protein